jgi:hypothetical protein
MSALGHKRTLRDLRVMSALPLKADMCGALAYVRFGPIADITTAKPLPGLALAAATSGLDRRTWHRPIRAEHATITWLRLQPLATALTVIEELAAVGWHLFRPLVPAPGTGDCRNFDHESPPH